MGAHGDNNTHSDEEGDSDHSEPREEEGQTIVTEGNNNEEEDAEGEEEGKTMDTDGNNYEEEDVEGERVHRYNTRSCTNLTCPFDFDQMASLSYAQFNNNRDSSDERDT